MDPILQVGIGVVLVFAITAVIVSSTTEIIAGVLHLRAQNLEAGIARMLDGVSLAPRQSTPWWKPWQLLRMRKPEPGPLAAQVLQHPLITSLASPSAAAKGHTPSYIDAVTFTAALFDTAFASEAAVMRFLPDKATIDARIGATPAGPTRTQLDSMWTTAKSAPKAFVQALVGDPKGEALVGALLGTPADVEAQLLTLTNANDAMAPALSGQWVGSGKNVQSFGQSLVTAPLITHANQAAASVGAAVAKVGAAEPRLGAILTPLWNTAGDDVDAFRHHVEDWYDREMARVSGWYSRKAQWIMLGLGLFIAAALNISGTTVAMALWHDAGLRDRTSAVAASVVVDRVAPTTATTVSGSTTATTLTPPPTAAAPVTPTVPSGTTATTTAPAASFAQLGDLGLPVGWNANAWPGLTWALVPHLLGIVMVGIAASFGAPFWFDLLNRLVNLRVGGKPPAPAAQQRPATSP